MTVRFIECNAVEDGTAINSTKVVATRFQSITTSHNPSDGVKHDAVNPNWLK